MARPSRALGACVPHCTSHSLQIQCHIYDWLAADALLVAEEGNVDVLSSDRRELLFTPSQVLQAHGWRVAKLPVAQWRELAEASIIAARAAAASTADALSGGGAPIVHAHIHLLSSLLREVAKPDKGESGGHVHSGGCCGTNG